MQLIKISTFTPIYNNANSNYKKDKKNISLPRTTFTASSSSASKAIRNTAIASLFLLPMPFGFSSCSDNKKESQGVEYVQPKSNTDLRKNFIDTIPNPNHTVKPKESLYTISLKYGVSVESIQLLNKNVSASGLQPGQVIKIPPSISVHGVKNISDASIVTGLSENYLRKLEAIENPKNIKTVHDDGNGNPTVGIGHKLLKSEMAKYKGRVISEEEKYTLLAKDLLEREDKIKFILAPNVYNNLPEPLRESVFDFVYHRGENAFRKNVKLVEALNQKNYPKAIANLYKNYTMAKNSKGKPYEKHMSGLCKRSLIRMGNASKIFKNDIPEEVLNSARATYEEGLRLLKEESDRGLYPRGSYKNIMAEYQDIVYNLFNGKIGVKTDVVKQNAFDGAAKKGQISKPAKVKSTQVYLNGTKLPMSKEEIEADWAKTAEKYKRSFKRPNLVLDSKGNITALVKLYNPTGKGPLNNKIIIVNQGHGGCAANNSSASAKTNMVFDPGCSNALMEPVKGKRGKFKRTKSGGLVLNETNKFIGNGGKALEEWKVNELFSHNLISKLTKAGAKVYFVSGEVHHAQDAIRKIESENKIGAFISFHSNAEEVITTKVGKGGKEYIDKRVTKRGFYIMPNNRGGLDQQDFDLAVKIHDRFSKNKWLNGLGQIRPESLGVLSISSSQTSPVPGVLIETGNLKHKTDVANLNSKEFREKLVQATYDGIVDFLTKKIKIKRI